MLQLIYMQQLYLLFEYPHLIHAIFDTIAILCPLFESMMIPWPKRLCLLFVLDTKSQAVEIALMHIMIFTPNPIFISRYAHFSRATTSGGIIR